MTCAWCPREALLTPFAVPVCARHFERAREIYDARHAARLQWPRAKAPPHDADELAGRAVDWSRPGPGWVPFTRT